jgi:hypothetical protein
MNSSELSIVKQISARLKTSSAVVPALLAAAISMSIGGAGLAISNGKHEVLFSICLLAPLAVLLLQITFFTLWDRDRLHNEEHIERRMMIDQERSIIGDNETRKQITLENSGHLIGNESAGDKHD